MGCAALGTQIPPFGSMAATVLRNALGLDDNAIDEDILECVSNASPEQLMKIKEAEQTFKIKLKEMDVKLEVLEKEDRNDARKFAKETGTKSINGLAIFNALFVIIITVGTFLLMYSGKIINMNALEASILTLLIREAFGRYEQVCNFFFGSSHGSKQKTELMDKR